MRVSGVTLREASWKQEQSGGRVSVRVPPDAALVREVFEDGRMPWSTTATFEASVTRCHTCVTLSTVDMPPKSKSKVPPLTEQGMHGSTSLWPCNLTGQTTSQKFR